MTTNKPKDYLKTHLIGVQRLCVYLIISVFLASGWEIIRNTLPKLPSPVVTCATSKSITQNNLFSSCCATVVACIHVRKTQAAQISKTQNAFWIADQYLQYHFLRLVRFFRLREGWISLEFQYSLSRHCVSIIVSFSLGGMSVSFWPTATGRCILKQMRDDGWAMRNNEMLPPA